MNIEVKYFAALREIAGRSDETLQTNASNVRELYQDLRQRYDFYLDESQLRVALNEEFKSFDSPLKDGDVLVFIPPVAGG